MAAAAAAAPHTSHPSRAWPGSWKSGTQPFGPWCSARTLHASCTCKGPCATGGGRPSSVGLPCAPPPRAASQRRTRARRPSHHTGWRRCRQSPPAARRLACRWPAPRSTLPASCQTAASAAPSPRCVPLPWLAPWCHTASSPPPGDRCIQTPRTAACWLPWKSQTPHPCARPSQPTCPNPWCHLCHGGFGQTRCGPSMAHGRAVTRPPAAAARSGCYHARCLERCWPAMRCGGHCEHAGMAPP
mmetsp:Transcript_39557/g.117662  ORF Transcript_39557/g.117662 Transcript_39557/m.117662 type:complete len:243 (-) Transcript_39557:603-1331(-)